MAVSYVTFEGLGQWETMTDPRKFMRELRKQVFQANKRLAIIFEDKVRRDIKNRSYKENSPLTILLKGSSKPLIDQGDLWASVSHEHKGPFEFHLGLIRETEQGHSIAFILHEGMDIEVDSGVRGFFWRKSRDTKGLVKPLKSSTGHIKIPPRPYLRMSLIDDESNVKPIIEMEWGAAIERTLEALARKGKGKGDSGKGGRGRGGGGGPPRDPKTGRFLPKGGGPKRDPTTGRFLPRGS